MLKSGPSNGLTFSFDPGPSFCLTPLVKVPLPKTSPRRAVPQNKLPFRNPVPPPSQIRVLAAGLDSCGLLTPEVALRLAVWETVCRATRTTALRHWREFTGRVIAENERAKAPPL